MTETDIITDSATDGDKEERLRDYLVRHEIGHDTRRFGHPGGVRTYWYPDNVTREQLEEIARIAGTLYKYDY